MADFPTTTRQEIHWLKSGQIPAGTRVVIVLNPATLTGGTVLVDRTVPVGKTFEGNVQIDGELK